MQVLYSDKKIEVRAKFPCDYVGTDLWVTGTWSPYGWHVSSVLFNDDADVIKQTRITTYDGYSEEEWPVLELQRMGFHNMVKEVN